MTVQQTIRNNIKNERMRKRISDSFLRRGIDLIPLDEFKKKYDYDTILTFHNIGRQTAKVLMEAINEEK